VKRGLEREALGVQVWDERTKRRYLEGHWIDRKGMARVEASYTYWGLVDRIARMFELPMMQARELLTRVRAEMEAVARRAKAMGTNFSGRVKMRTRDAAWVLENSDRYPKIRMEFGI